MCRCCFVLLCGLESKKIAGIDGIFSLKKKLSAKSRILMFNQGIFRGIFPNDLKIA